MAYQIDAGIWSSVFAVPAAVVDKHIKMCSPLSLKVLLVMLRNPGKSADAEWLSGQLNLPKADIADALGYWIGAGIITETSSPADPSKNDTTNSRGLIPVAASVTTERQSETTGQKIITIASRPKITQEDVVHIANSDGSVAQLLTEAQTILGAPLTPVESEILVALCSYYGMHSDVVLMLLQHCVSTGRRSMNYLEKTAANWISRGIITHEQVEQEIVRLSSEHDNEKKVVKAFGLYNRGLTPKEKEYIPRWFSLGLEEPLIFLACERAVENTGKVSFAYADKILTSWKTRGIKTIRAAQDDLNRPVGHIQNKSAQTGGDSSLDMDKIRQLLHQPFRE